MADVTVRLPGVLRPAVGDVREVAVQGATVDEALEDLCRRHPTLRPRLYDTAGMWRQHVLCVLHDEPVDPADAQPLTDGDELIVMPAVSGG